MSSERMSVKWVRANRCHATSDCLELARVGDAIALRDSKKPGFVLYYTVAEIEAFLDGAKRGDFDHLLREGRDEASGQEVGDI